MVIPFIRPKKQVTEEEKQEIVFKGLCAEYRATDSITNAVNIPYFLRAAQRLREIIQNDTLDKEYRNYRKKKEVKHG